MMTSGIAALMGLAGLTSAFALAGLLLAAWMAWRIVAKAGLPGWVGMISVLLTLTAVGTIVPLILLWVFAFMRWPRDDRPIAVAASTASGTGPAQPPSQSPPPAAATPVLAPPPQPVPDRRAWRLSGKLADGSAVSLAFDSSSSSWLLTGAPAAQPNDLSVPDPSVGRPHARLMIAGNRLGLADLGNNGGTFIDGARLLPEHGPRDISAIRTIRLGAVELALTRD
jgi:hypothetical protein